MYVEMTMTNKFEDVLIGTGAEDFNDPVRFSDDEDEAEHDWDTTLRKLSRERAAFTDTKPSAKYRPDKLEEPVLWWWAPTLGCFLLAIVVLLLFHSG